MGDFKMEYLDKIAINKYDSTVDKNRRITIRKSGKQVFTHYRTFELEDGTMVLKPMLLAPPDMIISAESLAMLDLSVKNALTGKVGGTFNPDEFRDLIDESDDED